MNKVSGSHVLFILLPVFGCAFISSSEILDASFLPRFLLLSTFLSLSIIWLLYNQWNVHQPIPWKHPVILFMLIWLVASIASFPNALNKSQYLAEIQKVFLYFITILVFSTTLNQQKESLQESVLKATVVSTLFLTAIGSWQFFNYQATLNVKGMMQVTSMMSNKNLFSEYIALCLPFSIAAIMLLKKIWKVLAIIASLSVCTFTIILLARSVWVALPVAFSVLVFIIILWNVLNNTHFKQHILKTLIISTASTIVFIALAWVLNNLSNDMIMKRLVSIFEIDKGSAVGRLQIWAITIDIIKSNLISGIGAGNWKLVFQSKAWQQSGIMYNTQPLNDYLGIFAECGLFGFIGYVGILLTGITLLIKQIFSAQNKLPVFHIACLASLLIYCVISFFNFPKDRIEHFVFLAFLLAFSSAPYFSATQTKKIITAPILLLIAVGLFYCQWSGYQRYVAEKHTRLALEAKNRQQWKTVIQEINKAKSPYYSLDPTTTPLLWYRGVAYYTLGKTDLAFLDFQSAYKANPYHTHVLNNLATCFQLKGNHQKAVTLYKEAIRINPGFEDALLNLTAVLYNLKQYDQALLIIEQSPQKEHSKLVMRTKLIREAKEAAKN